MVEERRAEGGAQDNVKARKRISPKLTSAGGRDMMDGRTYVTAAFQLEPAAHGANRDLGVDFIDEAHLCDLWRSQAEGGGRERVGREEGEREGKTESNEWIGDVNRAEFENCPKQEGDTEEGRGSSEAPKCGPRLVLYENPT